MVSANGAAPVMGIIESLDPRACRLRSINPFNVGDMLAFDFVTRGARKLPLMGKVLACTQNDARRVYTVVLHDADEDSVIASLDAASRHAAEHQVREIPTGNGLTRASARIPVDIPVQYSLAGGVPRDARATNVSAGGMLMNSTDEIAVGSTLELRFHLPGGAYDIAVHARVVAHQQKSPNYNMAFFGIPPEIKEQLESFVSRTLSS
jgi:hypothetical protein